MNNRTHQVSDQRLLDILTGGKALDDCNAETKNPAGD